MILEINSRVEGHPGFVRSTITFFFFFFFFFPIPIVYNVKLYQSFFFHFSSDRLIVDPHGVHGGD